MALVTVDQIKAVLKIEHDVDDDMLDLQRASALGAVVGFLDRPITAEEQTFVLEDPRPLQHGLARECWRPVRSLRIPMTPVSQAEEDAPVVVDVDGDTVDAADYRLNPRTGVLTGAVGVTFFGFPYTVTATVGLSARADYATVVEPAINQAIVDCVADWYQRRSPNASSESEGGGVSTSYADRGIPQRVRELLEPFRRVTP